MSSKQQPEKPILYLDRNFGSKIVPKLLRDAGIECEIHDDHLGQAAEDQEWIHLLLRDFQRMEILTYSNLNNIFKPLHYNMFSNSLVRW